MQGGGRDGAKKQAPCLCQSMGSMHFVRCACAKAEGSRSKELHSSLIKCHDGMEHRCLHSCSPVCSPVLSVEFTKIHLFSLVKYHLSMEHRCLHSCSPVCSLHVWHPCGPVCSPALSVKCA